jgi:hypothetical protein
MEKFSCFMKDNANYSMDMVECSAILITFIMPGLWLTSIFASESSWSNGGSCCALPYELMPHWQTGFFLHLNKKTLPRKSIVTSVSIFFYSNIVSHLQKKIERHTFFVIQEKFVQRLPSNFQKNIQRERERKGDREKK